MKIIIPNPGFYESLFSFILDSECEREAEYLEENEGTSNEDAATARIWSKETRNNVARAYVALFQEWIKEDLGLDVSLTFSRIISPAFYNFENDKIEIEIDDKDAENLFLTLIFRQDVREAIKYAGTPRSGYMPLVSPHWLANDWRFENLNPASWEVILTPLYNVSIEDNNRYSDLIDYVTEAIYEL